MTENELQDSLGNAMQELDKSLKNAEIDTYLCHCQNMLNGNIDGTVLHLEDLKEVIK